MFYAENFWFVYIFKTEAENHKWSRQGTINMGAKKILILLVLCTAIGPTANASIIVDDTISGSITNDFQSFPPAGGPAAGFLLQPGAVYGERFAGQTLSTAGGFDALTGTPTNPLTLLFNPVLADNIGIFPLPGSLVAFGALAVPGTGALSVLLGLDTDIFGLDVAGASGGSFTAQFFARDGSLLGAITQSGITNRFYGFRATGGDRIAGVSLTNIDSNGIAYDNVTFNRIPEPAVLALLGLGLAGIGYKRHHARIAE